MYHCFRHCVNQKDVILISTVYQCPFSKGYLITLFQFSFLIRLHAQSVFESSIRRIHIFQIISVFFFYNSGMKSADRQILQYQIRLSFSCLLYKLPGPMLRSVILLPSAIDVLFHALPTVLPYIQSDPYLPLHMPFPLLPHNPFMVSCRFLL